MILRFKHTDKHTDRHPFTLLHGCCNPYIVSLTPNYHLNDYCRPWHINELRKLLKPPRNGDEDVWNVRAVKRKIASKCALTFHIFLSPLPLINLFWNFLECDLIITNIIFFDKSLNFLDFCRVCGPCRDMIKYGGLGRLRQSCVKRRCLQPQLPIAASCSQCNLDGWSETPDFKKTVDYVSINFLYIV